MGWKDACRASVPLRKGLNIVEGNVVYPAVAEAFGLPLKDVDSLLN
jgi:alanine dehydrogenase